VLAILVRRVLWLIPTLFAVSLVTFLLFTFLPPRPREQGGAKDLAGERFAELPRFLNPKPLDVRARAADAMDRVARGGDEGARAERELAWLGGAALPYVIPGLDRYDPETRSRIALALAPVAIRMELPNREDARRADRASDFWVRFWADRSVEFRDAGVRTGVERLARYRTESRARELAQLDTYALPALIDRLEAPVDAHSLDVARTLVAAICHATDSTDRIEEGATLEEARAVVARWRKFWLLHESEFVAYDGASRASAALRETRYGKWAAEVVLSLTVKDDDTEKSLARLRTAIPITLGLIFGGIALAYVVGTAIGVASAVTQRKLPKAIVGTLIVSLHAIPAATLAVVFLAVSRGHAGMAAGIVIVSLGMLASPARHQRDALTSVFVRDFVRAARARGASFPRALVTQGLRQSLVATMAVASVEPPAALGAAFVTEQVLGLPGLGQLTVGAVIERDVTFLMGLVLGAVLLAGLLLLVSDLAQSALDPRLRGKLGRAQ